MMILVTGGSGVLGRATIPLLHAAGHHIHAPRHHELDLFNPVALGRAVSRVDAVLHLASRIPRPEDSARATAWTENDRLRGTATGLLVDAALDHPSVELFVLPSVTFLYPPGRATESTAVRQDISILRSMVAAEQQTQRFTANGRRGIVLRLGLLYGDAGAATAQPDHRLGGTLAVPDAAQALLTSLTAPAGTYNVVDDDQPISNATYQRVTTWRPSESAKQILR